MTSEPPGERPPWFREDFSPSYGVALAVNREILHTRSAFQDIFVFENEQWGKVMVLDGAVQLTEGDEFFYHEALVWPPLLFHPAPRSVLIVGGGDGGALEEVLKFPTVESVTLVEIDPAVIEIAKAHFQSVNHGAFDDPRVRLVVADAAEFLPADPARYDVILLDMSDPAGPSEPLYDKIYLAHARQHLRAAGILGMQSGSAMVRCEIFKTVRETVAGVFPGARSYAAPVPTYPGGLWTFTMAMAGASRATPEDESDERRGTGPRPTDWIERLKAIPAPRFITPGFLSDIFMLDSITLCRAGTSAPPNATTRGGASYRP